MTRRAAVGTNTLYGSVAWKSCGSIVFTDMIFEVIGLPFGSTSSTTTGLRLKGQMSPLTVTTPPEMDISASGLTTPTDSDGFPDGVISLLPEASSRRRTDFSDWILPCLSNVLTVRRATSAAAGISKGILIT